MTFLLTLFPCPIVVLKKSFEFKSRKELVALKLKKNNNLQPVLASNYIFLIKEVIFENDYIFMA